jgi:carboxypeptidase D
MQHMYSMPEPPFKLAGITVGNPALGTPGVFENAPIVQVLETYPQIIGYDPDVLDYFRDQAHLCKLDLNLSYPQQGGHLPSVHIKLGGFGRQSIGNSTAPPPGQGDGFSVDDAFGVSRRSFGQQVADAYKLLPAPAKRAHVREEARLRWKRQNIGFDGATSITARKDNKTGTGAGKGAYSGKKGHINSWYGCDLYHEMMYFAINYTAPWSLFFSRCPSRAAVLIKTLAELESFDFLDVPIALNPVKTILNPTTWMNDPQTRAAIHAPENADWTILRAYPWDNKAHGSDGSPATIDFSDEFAANASKAGVKVMWYSGNDDALSGHLGTESKS